jgi:hypothetical protein
MVWEKLQVSLLRAVVFMRKQFAKVQCDYINTNYSNQIYGPLLDSRKRLFCDGSRIKYMSLSGLFHHFSCSFIIFKTTGGENQIWEVTYIFKICDRSSPPPLMFKLHTRPTLSKSANSLFGCCLLVDDSPLTHICTTSLPSLQQTCYVTSTRLELLSRYNTFFLTLMVLFKMTCHETEVQKWTCRIHSRIWAIASFQWPFLWCDYADSYAILRVFNDRYTFCILILIRKWESGYRMWTGFIWLTIWIIGTWWSVCRTGPIRAGWRSVKVQTWI